ncbi:hypothetical protein ABZP36_006913 [Zizania latifolia]
MAQPTGPTQHPSGSPRTGKRLESRSRLTLISPPPCSNISPDPRARRRRRPDPVTFHAETLQPCTPPTIVVRVKLVQVLVEMASTACFVIVSKNGIPIYEAEVGSAPKKEDLAYQHQFILHAALDVVQDLAWTTNTMFLKSVDRFSDLVVSVYVTAGHIL